MPRMVKATSSLLCSLMLLLVLFSGCLQNNSNDSGIEVTEPEEPVQEEQTIGGTDPGQQISEEDEEVQQEIPLSIAFIVDSESFGTQNDPAYMAQIISDFTILDITPYPVESEEAMIESLRFGHVDLAMMDAASSWMSWKNYDLQVLLADQENYGRTYYNSNAWVKSDSDIATYHIDNDPLTDPFSLFEGKKPCHTGWFDSVGMLLPMGFLLGLGYANVAGDPNDIESLLFTIQDFLDDDPPIPEAGTKYYGYSGALRCLSDGTGDVAFIQDSTVDDYCSEDGQNTPSWCLPEDDYTVLPTFGRSPSNALMFNPEYLDSEISQQISEELVRLSGISDMDQALKSVFGTTGFTPTNSLEHLEGYSSLIYNIPGMQAYFEDPSNTAQVNLSVEEITIGVIGPLSNSSSISFGFLADSISDDIGINASISVFENSNSLVENLSNGIINFAILDGVASWKAWKYDGMSVLASLLNEREMAFHQLTAIVKSDSELAGSSDPFAALDGISPCFSSNSDPSTLLTIGHLIREGLADDIPEIGNSSIIEIIQSVFDSNYSFPEEDSELNGPNGELRCISQGHGDIAFVIGDEVEIFCDADLQPSEDTWCLDPEEFETLPSIGVLPYQSVIYDPTVLDMVSRTAVLNSLLSLNYEMFLDNFTTMGSEYTGCYDISIHKIDESSPRGACGSEILSNSLISTGVSRATSQSHLGPLSTLMGNLPNQLLVDFLVEN